MNLPFSARATQTLAVAIAVCAVPTGAFAQSVSVTLNGSPLSLNPAPQSRAGRVFVPLRGIFEQLGASVVYANGTINAQGNGRAISLHIGSTQATVNGQPQALDVAPFVVGASTYVPLRFVSQALGASVNYDAANKLVAISNGGGAPNQNANIAPPNASVLRLGALRPGRDATVAARRPTIEAQFENVQADPNSLRISLDDLDVTSSTSRSPAGFLFSPQSDLQSMRHTVRVTGMDAHGVAFHDQWRFSSGTTATENILSDLRPGDGAQVGPQFTVSGRTIPGSQVVVQVGASRDNSNTVAGAVGAILGFGGGANVRNEVTANADGSFSTIVRINAPPGTNLQMIVNSTDPGSKSAARPVSRTLTLNPNG